MNEYLHVDTLLKKSARLIERNSSIPLLVLLVLLSLLFPAVLFPSHGIGRIKPLDLHFSYSPDRVYEHLTMLGPDGRTAYTGWALTSDLAFPVIYSLTLSVALMLVLRELSLPASRLRYRSLLPFLTVILDWCENLSLVWATYVFPERVDSIASLASSFTSLKWILIVSTVLILSVAVSFWTVVGLRGR